MTLSIDDVKKIAKLSMLEISDEDLPKFQNDLNKIFPWITQLNEVDVSNVEPLIGIENQILTMREDIAVEQGVKEDLMKAAPESRYGYYSVPKVIE